MAPRAGASGPAAGSTGAASFAILAGSSSEAFAAKKGAPLKVAMSRRYLTNLMLARQMARSGELGKEVAIEGDDLRAVGDRVFGQSRRLRR